MSKEGCIITQEKSLWELQRCSYTPTPPAYALYLEGQVDWIRERFAGDYREPTLWEARARTLSETEGRRENRATVADALFKYHRLFGHFPHIEAAIHKFKSERAWVVVGGQQTMLLGGPMFVFFKALMIIQTARRLEKKLHHPVIPVFWLASEDHDWEEVSRFHTVDADWHVQTIVLPYPDHQAADLHYRPSVSRVKVPRESMQRVLEEVIRSWPDTEFKEALSEKLTHMLEEVEMIEAGRTGGATSERLEGFEGLYHDDRIRASLSPGLTLNRLFARILIDWFAEDGLVLLDSDDPDLRRLEVPMFEALIRENDAFQDALRIGGEAVQRFSLEPRLTAGDPDRSHIFLNKPYARTALLYDRNVFYDRLRTERLSKDDLLSLLHKDPTLFSSGVAARPLVQEYLLPTLAVVLGPSELAYWAELKEAMMHFGQVLPPIVPRFQGTIVDGATRKVLRQLSCDALIGAGNARYLEEKRQAYVAELEEMTSIKDALEALSADLVKHFETIIPAFEQVEKNLGSLALEQREKFLKQVAELEKKARSVVKKQHDSAWKRFDRLEAMLAPLHQTQERVLSPYHFLCRYGPEWLTQMKALDLPDHGRMMAIMKT
ncbi:MAG: bacillithiol biosynthesis BshC [Candidatus Carbobacillus altaicus]|nr:bacillithiol biosynthesis BshC [Candidatus Carbobacillus altaicus]